MDDLIRRSAVRDALYDADAVTMRGVAIINTFPAVDAVEVVRCKDCKKCSKTTDRRYLCDRHAHIWNTLKVGSTATLPNDFCSYGERKDNV